MADSILVSLGKMFGIGKMKAEKALDASINQIDKVKLAIDNEEKSLKQAQISLKDTRKQYILIKKEIESAQGAIEEMEKKAFTLVENLRRQGKDDNEIAGLLAGISDDTTRQIQRYKAIVTSKTPVAAQLQAAIGTFEDKIRELENKVANNKNQVAMLQTSLDVATTSRQIASANSTMNADSSSAEIEKAMLLVNETEADAQAMLEQSDFQTSNSSKLDKLLSESSMSSEDNPFAKALGSNKPTPAITA